MKRAIQNSFKLLIVIVFLGVSCQKLDPVPVTKFCSIPPAINISYTSATVNGKLMDIGDEITAYGHCWSKTPNPTLSGFKSEIKGIPGKQAEFTSELRALTPGTKYYVRAYTFSKNDTKYSEEISFTTNTVPANQLVDCDNNLYNTVVIGTQTWMKSNLKVTRFNDGLDIPFVNSAAEWAALSSPAYSWYDNNVNNKNTYGALYNWYTAKSAKLCPVGWHVPSNAEWTELSTYLGGEGVAGGKLKEVGTTHWLSPNTGATNESDFTALPGGKRNPDGSYWGMGIVGFWFSSTEYDSGFSWARDVANDKANMSSYYSEKQLGFSIRCVKN
jgi:uncharacterized protein (TIGR02145 family)